MNISIESVRTNESGWAQEDLESPLSCMACGAASWSVCYTGLKDLLGHTPGRWDFIICRECRSLHLSPRPTLAAIGDAYPESYVTHHHADTIVSNTPVWRLINDYLNSQFGTEYIPSNRWGRWIITCVVPIRLQLDYFFRHLPRVGGRLLDVGCGSGAFLKRAEDAGWYAEGIEPDSQACAAARRNGVHVVNASIETFEPKENYHRITMSHVFEHLHDPANALRVVRSWLHPGGSLWMALPNPSGLGHRFYSRSWFALDPPRHLFLPTPEVVLKMMRDAGFGDVRLLRRGRGARSSILPSSTYASINGGRLPSWIAHGFVLAIDILSSVFRRASEEIVVIGTRLA